MNSPAYLRVFNSINTGTNIEDRGLNPPYLTMLINPEFDTDGTPVGAEIIGDFLEERETYAAPFPTHVGESISVWNTEYPGKESVLVAPVLNGYDLSSWAQVPSGKVRIAFYYRPLSDVPFFQLEKRYKINVLKDTLLDLTAGEVYTLQALERDFNTRERGIVVRQETFHKQGMADSLVYVNFYNYSAKGFWQADDNRKNIFNKTNTSISQWNYFKQGIRDTMNVFMTLYDGPYAQTVNSTPNHLLISDDYAGRYMTTIYRDNTSGKVAPYQSFPLWLNPLDNGIRTKMFQGLQFLAPGLVPFKDPIINITGQNTYAASNGSQLAMAYFFKNSFDYSANGIYQWVIMPDMPNMIITTPSGQDNPRSFATVNTVEVINNSIYLMTIQRRYAPPVLY
ncbi:hypothetical protein [Sphingobacterium sp. LRF_L2]|uniref:hypothetical protein n=1 Tax=Sphingobacterium sp. LRF_L2 TaxID=3369421 RepID=UPI003F6340CE